jgi:hypothetical protein
VGAGTPFTILEDEGIEPYISALKEEEGPMAVEAPPPAEVSLLRVGGQCWFVLISRHCKSSQVQQQEGSASRALGTAHAGQPSS